MDAGKNPHALNNQEKWINLNKKEIKHIFIYYTTLLFVSFAAGIFLLVKFGVISVIEIELRVIVGFSISWGLLGSTFYYIRKLYKSCIQELVNDEEGVGSIKALGTKAYFYFRPIMGFILATVASVGIYGGFFVLQNQPSIIAERFYLFVSIFSFLIGFSNGKFIVKLDNSAEKMVQMIGFAKESKQDDE